MIALGAPIAEVAADLTEAGFNGEFLYDKWLGRKGALVIEVVGEPVAQISIVAPPNGAFGQVVNIMTEVLSDDASVLKAWAVKCLDGHARRASAGGTLDVAKGVGRVRMALRTMGTLMVVTWALRNG